MLYVNFDEEEEYRRWNSGTELKSFQAATLGAMMNRILDNEEYPFFVFDDDINFFTLIGMYGRAVPTSRKVNGPELAECFHGIERLGCLFDISCLGVSTNSAIFYSARKHGRFKRSFGGSRGVFFPKDPGIRFDEQLQASEDYDFFCDAYEKGLDAVEDVLFSAESNSRSGIVGGGRGISYKDEVNLSCFRKVEALHPYIKRCGSALHVPEEMRFFG